MKYLLIVCVLFCSGIASGQPPTVYLSLTADDGRTTTMVVDERGVSSIPFLAKGKYKISLTITSPIFSPTKYPRKIFVEWISVDLVKKRNRVLENQEIRLVRDTTNILQSGSIGEEIIIENDDSYTVLCKTHISPIYTKQKR